MRRLSTLLLALALALPLVLSVGCSQKHNTFGFVTAEKEGRLYVFVPNSAAHQLFKKSGDPGKSVTRIGAGPNGMTVIAENEKVMRDYLGEPVMWY